MFSRHSCKVINSKYVGRRVEGARVVFWAGFVDVFCTSIFGTSFGVIVEGLVRGRVVRADGISRTRVGGLIVTGFICIDVRGCIGR